MHTLRRRACYQFAARVNTIALKKKDATKIEKVCTTHCAQKNLAYYAADLKAITNGRCNHPSIMQSTLLNEADMWQLFPHFTKPYDLPGLLHFARGLAPDHLIDFDSGANGNYNPHGCGHLGDVVDLHTYPAPSLRPNASDTHAVCHDWRIISG